MTSFSLLVPGLRWQAAVLFVADKYIIYYNVSHHIGTQKVFNGFLVQKNLVLEKDLETIPFVGVVLFTK